MDWSLPNEKRWHFFSHIVSRKSSQLRFSFLINSSITDLESSDIFILFWQELLSIKSKPTPRPRGISKWTWKSSKILSNFFLFDDHQWFSNESWVVSDSFDRAFGEKVSRTRVRARWKSSARALVFEHVSFYATMELETSKPPTSRSRRTYYG